MFFKNVKKFCSLVLSDSLLQKSLSQIQDRQEFINQFVIIGSEHGYKFTAQDFISFINRNGTQSLEKNNLDKRIHTLSNWVPVRINKIKNKFYAELCYSGENRFVEPFFYDSITKCLRNPFAFFFRQKIEVNDFIKLTETINGLQPSLFIFHMSRCGSTLISQMLSSLRQNIIYSEPTAVDHALRIDFDNRGITEEERILRLKAVINKLGQTRSREEKYLFIKFDSWHIKVLPLIKKAFPDVPCIFIYRSPLEVMVSHNRQRGIQMVPGLIQPSWFGFDKDIAGTTNLNEYTACVLAEIMKAALNYCEEYFLGLIN